MTQPTEALVRPPATRRHLARPIVRAIALLALAALALLGYKGWRVYAATQPLRADVQALKALADVRPDAVLAKLGPLLARARADTLALQAEAQPLLSLTPHLGWVPIYGQDMASAGPLLDTAVDLTGAADDLLAVIAPLAPVIQDVRSLDSAMITQLAAAQPRLATVRATVGRASATWASVRPNLSPSTLDQLRPVGALAPLIESVASIVIAVGHVGSALAPLAEGGSLSGVSAETFVTQLADAHPQLVSAQAEIAQASEALDRAPREALPSGMRPGLDQLGSALAQARDGIELALILPVLLGTDHPRQYMVVAQSPDELRATGGFLSSIGVLTMDYGHLQLNDLRDTAYIDDIKNQIYPDPPAPLLRYMNSEMWLFRDANWSPDVPTSAHAMTELYQLGTGRTITDVIIFDPTALQLILGATGPLTVVGSPVPVSSANLRQYMLTQYDRYWGQSSESFIGPLSVALLDRIVDRPAGLDLLALGRAVQRALDERHILITVADPAVAAVLARRGWDGALRPGANDYLMVVDSNIGYDKVSTNIDQRVLYTVDLSDLQAPTATLSITYTHRISGPETCNELDALARAGKTYETWMVNCYQDYLRILIPGGSELIDAPARPIPAEWTWDESPDPGEISVQTGEAGTTILSVFLAIPLGGTHETYAHYALPANVLTQKAGVWHYQLTVQKQPARGNLPYTIRMQLPAGATLVAATPVPARQEGQTLTFRIDRAAGETIMVDFTPE